MTWKKEGKAFGSSMALPRNLGGIMLDSSTSDQPGGTGIAFDWREAQPWVAVMTQLHPVVLAGGLKPENVSKAIAILKPWGVDVVSGVESSPGKKDPEKVRAFVRAVREMDRKTG
jgi:phosphoribosylanthranilate isomerase